MGAGRGGAGARNRKEPEAEGKGTYVVCGILHLGIDSCFFNGVCIGVLYHIVYSRVMIRLWVQICICWGSSFVMLQICTILGNRVNV